MRANFGPTLPLYNGKENVPIHTSSFEVISIFYLRHSAVAKRVAW